MSEYLVDRLRKEIATLEAEVLELRERSGIIMVVEVLLAVVCFLGGYAFGVWYGNR